MPADRLPQTTREWDGCNGMSRNLRARKSICQMCVAARLVWYLPLCCAVVAFWSEEPSFHLMYMLPLNPYCSFSDRAIGSWWCYLVCPCSLFLVPCFSVTSFLLVLCRHDCLSLLDDVVGGGWLQLGETCRSLVPSIHQSINQSVHPSFLPSFLPSMSLLRCLVPSRKRWRT
jgi:hypothetical protein